MDTTLIYLPVSKRTINIAQLEFTEEGTNDKGDNMLVLNMASGSTVEVEGFEMNRLQGWLTNHACSLAVPIRIVA